MDIDVNQIVEIVKSVINNISFNLFSDIEDKTFPILNKLIFINKDMVNTSLMKKLLVTQSGEEFENNLLILASIFLFGILLWYGARMLLSYHLGLATVQRPFQFISRVIILGTLAFSSLEICTGIIDINYNITQYILNIPYKTTSISKELGTSTISFTTLKKYMEREKVFENEEDINVFSLDGVIRGFINFGMITLVVTYSLRYILIKVLVLLSPFAFLCLIDKSTENLFKNWLKAFMGLVFMQVFIAFVLIIPIALINQLKMDSDIYLLNKIFLAGSIYALYKANEFVRELIGGIGISANVYNGVNMLKSLIGR